MIFQKEKPLLAIFALPSGFTEVTHIFIFVDIQMDIEVRVTGTLRKLLQRRHGYF